MPSWGKAAGVAFALLIATTPAAAQEPGVVFDEPNDPVSKEYAVPLDSAREAGSGGAGLPSGDGAEGADSSPPVFGEGLSKDAGEERTPGSRDPDSQIDGQGGGASPQDPTGEALADAESPEADGESSTSAAAVADRPDSNSSTKALGGMAVAVLIGGAGLALLLRRSRARA